MPAELGLLALAAAAVGATTKPGQRWTRDAWKAAGGPKAARTVRDRSADLTGRAVAAPVKTTVAVAGAGGRRFGGVAERRLAVRREHPPLPVFTLHRKPTSTTEDTMTLDQSTPVSGQREHREQKAERAWRRSEADQRCVSAARDASVDVAVEAPRTGSGRLPGAEAPRSEEDLSAALTAFGRRLGNSAEQGAELASNLRSQAAAAAAYAEALAGMNMDAKVVGAMAQLADDLAAMATAYAQRSAALAELATAPKGVYRVFLSRYSGTREDAGKGVKNIPVKGFFNAA